MEGRLGRDVPVAEVAIHLVTGVELQESFLLEVLEVDGLSLDHGDLRGHRSDPFEAGQRFLHVVQHAEVEHDVEDADLRKVGGGEVGHGWLDTRAECGGGEFEAPATR